MTKLSVAIEMAWMLAAGEAGAARHPEIMPAHMLIGLCSLSKLLHAETEGQITIDPAALVALRSEWHELRERFVAMKIEPTTLRRTLRDTLGEGTYTHADQETIHRSATTRAAFERAEAKAGAAHASAMTAPHLLNALLEAEDETIRDALSSMGVDAARYRAAADNLARAPQGSEPDPTYVVGTPEPVAVDPGKQPRPGNGAPLHAANGDAAKAAHDAPLPHLLRYGRDLTALARAGQLDPPIGRRAEMQQIVNVLARDSKNNPLLVGDAGVGKTAIVAGLAHRIATGNPPPALQGRRIIELDVGSLVAGTRYRGDFEERLRAVLAEIEAHPEVCVFIDEVHLLVGAGAAGDSAMDAANLLKPALARGGVRLIGATTPAEYARYIERDAALARRFHPIDIGEPSAHEALEILRGVARRYEAQRGVQIADDTVVETLRLAQRYLPERRLPDKAIDLLDEACAAQAAHWPSMVAGIAPSPSESGRITPRAVQEVLSRRTGIPVGECGADDMARLRGMAAALKARVIGQPEACEALAHAVQRARLGIGAPDRPVGVFLFFGPTGVGKTALARATAAFLFGDEKALVRIDMSEYAEAHTVSRLIGAPPGYVGHESEGQLTGPLRRRPYCVVLLDEIEKAHAEVRALFLQLFDAGRLTDAHGRTVDARNAVFIATANLGQQAQRAIGFHVRGSDELRRRLIEEGLKPEFVNRLDEVIAFHPLGPDELAVIAEQLLAGLRVRLRAQGIALNWGAGVARWLADHTDAPEFGARSLQRLFERAVEGPLAERLLDRRLGAGTGVLVETSASGLGFAAIADPHPTQ